ncbi:hypothetical protein C6502_08185 [Candidatus Poribacteria bacterium]|nr:MAG: hypothetical protein C6502_08185 [Candidatus Poribacteria bacterium]
MTSIKTSDTSNDEANFVSGIDLARMFYIEVVCPLIEGRAHSAARLGSGSDVLGFDTPRSTDHGWGPQLHLFVATSEVDAVRTIIDYSLPEEFHGGPVYFGWDEVAVKHHVNVAPLGEWLKSHLGFDPQVGITVQNWLTTPQQLLLEVTAGAVFHDPDGDLKRVRNKLEWYPNDIWLWMLACQWRRIAQEEAFVGRTAEVGDELGSRILTAQIVRDLMRLCFLIERRYAPYSKWLGSAFRNLHMAPRLAPLLEAALKATDYPTREKALCSAYEYVAHCYNQLNLTPPVDPEVRLFYKRPFRVIGGDRFAETCLAAVQDEWLKGQPLVGSVDQFVDSTDVLSNAHRSRCFTNIYGVHFE